jgi:hypothetical protein
MLLALLVTVLAAIAVPALAQERVVAPTFDRKASSKALKAAKQALHLARAAEEQARLASQNASGAKVRVAQLEAKLAEIEQGSAPVPPVPVPQVQSGLAAAAGTTESETPVQLEGGPSVAVTAPSSGLVEVWAQATVEGPGYVSLFQDGQPMPGQTEFCAPEEGIGVLFAAPGLSGEPETVGTPSANLICSTTGAPGPVLFQTSPGQHTYELRYGTCGCGEPVEFSQRLLRVAPRP